MYGTVTISIGSLSSHDRLFSLKILLAAPPTPKSDSIAAGSCEIYCRARAAVNGAPAAEGW